MGQRLKHSNLFHRLNSLDNVIKDAELTKVAAEPLPDRSYGRDWALWERAPTLPTGQNGVAENRNQFPCPFL